MRKPLLLSAAVALIASVVALVQWRELRAERELSAGLQVRLAEAEARASRSTPLSVAASNMTVGAEGAPPVTDKAEVSATSVAPPAMFSSPNQRDLLEDPEYRDARLAQIRRQLPEIHPGLAEELDLSPAEADELFDLLAKNQLEIASTTAFVPGPNGQIDEAQIQELQRVQEMRAQQESALASKLGDARYAKWQEYEQTRPARQRIAQMGRSMDAAGAPLTSAQMKPLRELMLAEQAQQRQERQALLRNVGANAPSQDASAAARSREENFARQAESNRRLIAAAAAFLDARQLELFRESLEGQLAINRASSRLNQQAAPP